LYHALVKEFLDQHKHLTLQQVEDSFMKDIPEDYLPTPKPEGT
jgi:hypothetical protein